MSRSALVVCAFFCLLGVASASQVDSTGGGDDTLYGSDGDDAVLGELGDDELHGGVGNDELQGHNGADEFWAGPGDDQIVSDDANPGPLDPTPDRIRCGPGEDTVYMGPEDHVARGCEFVYQRRPRNDVGYVNAMRRTARSLFRVPSSLVR